MTSWQPGGRIVLSDFGLAKRLNAGTDMTASQHGRRRMHTNVGTADYSAPEVHCNQYTRKISAGYDASVDLWSVGAVTAILLTSEHIVTALAARGNPRYRSPEQRGSTEYYDFSVMDDDQDHLWGKVPRRPRDFIKRLLVLDADKRLSAAQALQHSWFTKTSYKSLMDTLYARAVAGWRPGPRVEPQTVDTQHLATRMGEDVMDICVVPAAKESRCGTA